MKKKIGIVTQYYNSTNYGGNLQAYALCAVLDHKGYNAEQICFPFEALIQREKGVKALFSRGFCYFFKKVLRRVKYMLVNPIIEPKKKREEQKHQVRKKRTAAFFNFNRNLIPHSREIYNSESIGSCVENYDVFITGSDQVWNFDWYNPSYFLDFVPSSKTKMSYAASVAMPSLTKQQAKIVKNSLQDYKAISVREKSAVKLLEGLSPVEVQTVLDPTLLLTKEEWDKVCSDRVINEDYIFCYFLGDNQQERKIVEEFARLHSLKVVVIPHIVGIKLIERNFGDERLYDASPEQFLSLIKHAKYVFTDSFHAVVFSNIYQKQYFVFNRSQKGEMSSRIVDITKLFHQEERFCAGKNKENVDYVTSLSDIDYTKENKDFEKLKQASIEFLEKNLKD